MLQALRDGETLGDGEAELESESCDKAKGSKNISWIRIGPYATAAAAVAPGAQEVQVEGEEAPATLLEVPAGHSVALMEERGQ